jgi:hypothetical protein
MIGEYLEIQKKMLKEDSKDLESLNLQIIEFYDKGKGMEKNIFKKKTNYGFEWNLILKKGSKICSFHHKRHED